MNKTGRTLITVAVVLAGAVLASALLQKFSPNDSWLAFAGWVIFFVAIQLPIFIVGQSSQGSCTAWLTRSQKKVMKP
jgi:membrane protein YdbS with pleckstrin-like domain